MKPDIEKYLPYLDHLDATEEEKIEIIHSVWHIMEAFVDQAFGLCPSQQIKVKPSKTTFVKVDENSVQMGFYVFQKDKEPEEEQELVEISVPSRLVS